MDPVTVLVIEEEGSEATLLHAALARQPELRVVDAPDVERALKRLKARPGAVALVLVGERALAKSATGLKKLATRGIPVVGLTARELAPAARQRALAAGVREIHERPREWRRYSQLVDNVVLRFIT